MIQEIVGSNPTTTTIKQKRIRTYSPEQLKKQREYGKKWYEKDKQKTIERNKKNRAKSRDWFKAYLKTLSCLICGENDPATFDFHHLDPSQKDYSVGAIAGQTYSIEKVKEEIAKCVCLCANCHRKVHAGTVTLFRSAPSNTHSED